MMIFNHVYEMDAPTLWEVIITLVPLTLLVIGIQLYIYWMEKDAERFLTRNKKDRKEFIDNNKTNEEFESLLQFAEQEVKNLISNLPDEVKKLAEDTPCVFEPTLMTKDNGMILGIYHPFFKFIVIYMGSITEYVKNNTDTEIGWLIRKTYLHELAHRFGLNEQEVAERGLANA